MADYDWFDHEKPTDASIIGNKWRALGLYPVYKDAHTMGGQPLYISHYICRRGCGCLVGFPDDHIKNVCTTFNPIVGENGTPSTG